ncbi:MAG: RnfABCDGE type electron transport complex subunit D [Elusimicrobiota bacterium]
MNKKIKENIKNIKLNPAPYLRDEVSMAYMMRWTFIALLFPVAGSIYFFGTKAFFLVIVCVISSVITDILCSFLRGKSINKELGSSVVTGLILALVLPPSFPLWAAFIGAVFGVGVTKHIFGGLGKNIFNPALMARAFLTAAFPILITTYNISPRQVSFVESKTGNIEATSKATPLTKFKFEDKGKDRVKIVADGSTSKNFMLKYFFGSHKGSNGETSALLILIGLAVLLWKKIIDWRLPLSYFLTIIVFSALLWGISPQNFLDPLSTIFLGGVLLGGTYMVTDPVTTPVTGKGKWVFGIGAGLLTLLIRNFGGYPEGVMFSILLMNAVTPLINRFTRPRIYGT